MSSDTNADPLLDVSGIVACDELCFRRSDCVAAVYDSENRKCYFWSFMLEQRKVAHSGVWLLTAMCPEELVQVQ